MYNVPTSARNAIVSMVKKAEDNVLRVMTTLVITATVPKWDASKWASRRLVQDGN